MKPVRRDAVTLTRRDKRRQFVIDFLRSAGEDAPLDEGILMMFIEAWEGRNKDFYS